jgi:hypothetical protein
MQCSFYDTSFQKKKKRTVLHSAGHETLNEPLLCAMSWRQGAEVNDEVTVMTIPTA